MFKFEIAAAAAEVEGCCRVDQADGATLLNTTAAPARHDVRDPRKFPTASTSISDLNLRTRAPPNAHQTQLRVTLTQFDELN